MKYTSKYSAALSRVPGALLILAISTGCMAQVNPAASHLERDLRGPRFDRNADDDGWNRTNAIEPSQQDPLGPGTVSMGALRRRIPKDAKRAFNRAASLSSRQDYAGAARALELAVVLYPDFAEAHGNLGANYLRLGLTEQSIAASLRALALEPLLPDIYVNLALAYYRSANDDLAISYAERALRLDPGRRSAHYALGLSLMGLPEKQAEAIRHLALAAEKIPEAAQELSRLRSGMLSRN